MEDKLRPATDLAVACTVVANERSLLAYVRTAEEIRGDPKMTDDANSDSAGRIIRRTPSAGLFVNRRNAGPEIMKIFVNEK